MTAKILREMHGSMVPKPDAANFDSFKKEMNW